MGIMNTKKRPVAPASGNQRAECGRTSEICGTLSATEIPSDVAQMTTQVHRVEDSTRQPTPEENEDHILVPCERMVGQRPQEVSLEGSETGSFVGASGASEVAHGISEEGEIAPEVIDRIDKLMADSAAPSTRTDFLCQPCRETLLGEGSGDSSEGSTPTLDYEFFSRLMSEPEPWISKEHAQVLLPPVEMLDSWDTIKRTKPWKEFKESCLGIPVTEVTGVQASSLATQQQPPPESAHISDTPSQVGPSGEDAGMTDEEDAEILACSGALETQEKGMKRTVGGQKQETGTESFSLVLSASYMTLDIPPH